MWKRDGALPALCWHDLKYLREEGGQLKHANSCQPPLCRRIEKMIIRKLLPSPLAFPYHDWRVWTLLQLIQSPCWAADVLNCFDPPPSDVNLIGGPSQIAGGNLPCDPSAVRSTCCGLGWACLENGLCLSTSDSPRTHAGIYALGQCTDPEWKSDVCFSPCKG